jgi:hypothetical protein
MRHLFAFFVALLSTGAVATSRDATEYIPCGDYFFPQNSQQFHTDFGIVSQDFEQSLPFNESEMTFLLRHGGQTVSRP